MMWLSRRTSEKKRFCRNRILRIIASMQCLAQVPCFCTLAIRNENHEEAVASRNRLCEASVTSCAGSRDLPENPTQGTSYRASMSDRE